MSSKPYRKSYRGSGTATSSGRLYHQGDDDLDAQASQYQNRRQNQAQYDPADAGDRLREHSDESDPAFRSSGKFSSGSAVNSIERQRYALAQLTELDERLGFPVYTEGPDRLGWLINMHATSVLEDVDGASGTSNEGGTGIGSTSQKQQQQIQRAAVDLYFLGAGSTSTSTSSAFKVTVTYSPYFFVLAEPGYDAMVEDYLRRTYIPSRMESVSRVIKEDLKLPNHLLGNQRVAIKLSFRNISDLLTVRKDMDKAVKKNKEKNRMQAAFGPQPLFHAGGGGGGGGGSGGGINSNTNGNVTTVMVSDPTNFIVEMREYDVPYYLRVAIDLNLRVGLWYNVRMISEQPQVQSQLRSQFNPQGAASQSGPSPSDTLNGSSVTTRSRTRTSRTLVEITLRPDLVKRAEPVIFAFDIETTKLPLKFPDAATDQIMMISYMISGHGHLITNREIVSADIEDFEYTPKPEFPGQFQIFNARNEKAVLERFFSHIQQVQPTVVVSYNGDFFDWPFIHTRAQHHGLDMTDLIGFYRDEDDEYKSKRCLHMDCFRWVKRDSYLPAGSHGLKAVTKHKLRYNPDELDPEEMTPCAQNDPHKLAQYAVSDAVATYYLYMKYVHPFIFSLCTIIPLNPDEVLRKGSGTLCEILLMVEAFRANVIMPNKHEEKLGKMHDGHLLTSETYVGGHVEALEAGVFRDDIPVQFHIVPSAVQQLINDLDSALRYTIEVECKTPLENVENYSEVKQSIVDQLQALKNNPDQIVTPLIYHLDVAAMYPNIILTNRLQPDAMVSEAMCAGCDFNVEDKTCDRRMEWDWRGEYLPAQRDDYNMIKAQLEIESFPPSKPGGGVRPFHALSPTEQHALIQKRLTEYSRKSYGRVKVTEVVTRESIICQRENPFYIDTVKAFRDRRYEYKGLNKKWKGKLDAATAPGSSATAAEKDEASKMVVLYDSLQLAHKCILNSFYGYVMRKGARWYSMEMAGIVCLTGSRIIQLARSLVEQVGRPLELDTDGIWCILPRGFPCDVSFKIKGSGKPLRFTYPCAMLNHLVYDKFTNHDYEDLVNPVARNYEKHSENSIFFEVDGPYRAMILPASTEEDRLLKKRYAVFNHDGSLAELKGFEIKRRGELKLVKLFQSQIFPVFLHGDSGSLSSCYSAVAKVADDWLDLLYSKAVSLPDDELLELVSENRSMSKSMEEYGSQKSTSITTARRLAELLGKEMVKDKGLACKFIIANKPVGAPVTERAIPTVIFSSPEAVRIEKLRLWLKDGRIDQFDLRSILDWNYYLERFGALIQKIITIPAAMQSVSNPVPRVKHPQWLAARLAKLNDKFKQLDLRTLLKQQQFKQSSNNTANNSEDRDIIDVEDVVTPGATAATTITARRNRLAGSQAAETDLDIESESAAAAVQVDINRDYVGWLASQRPLWRKSRQERANKRQLGLSAGNIGSDSSSRAAASLSTFFARQHDSILTKTWHILQIQPVYSSASSTDSSSATTTAATVSTGSTAGQVRLWALIDGVLHSFTMAVPRSYYVNSRVPNKGASPSSSDSTSPLSNTAFQSVDASAWEEAPRNTTLPRDHVSLNLSRFILSEPKYNESQQFFSNLFNHPDVMGAYETQLTAVERAVLSVGSKCKLTQFGLSTRKNKSFAKDTMAFGELMRINDGPTVKAASLEKNNEIIQRDPYLASYLPSADSKVVKHGLRYVYMFHLATETRAIVVVFAPYSGSVAVFVHDGPNGRVQLPNLSDLYKQLYSAHFPQQPQQQQQPPQQPPSQQQQQQQQPPVEERNEKAFEYPSNVTVTQRSAYSSMSGLYDAVSRHLATLRSVSNDAASVAGTTSTTNPLVVIVQSSWQIVRLLHSISGLRDVPQIQMTLRREDHHDVLFSQARSLLSWQSLAAQRSTANFLTCSNWLYGRIEMARFADVPVGNLASHGAETTLNMLDVAVARAVSSRNGVLWWSKGELPDLGGREKDNHLDLVVSASASSSAFNTGPSSSSNRGSAVTSSTFGISPSQQDTLQTSAGSGSSSGVDVQLPEFNNSGSYSTICVELKVFDLAMNAILQYSFISELEGSISDSSTGAIGTASSSSSSAAGTSNAAGSDSSGFAQAARQLEEELRNVNFNDSDDKLNRKSRDGLIKAASFLVDGLVNDISNTTAVSPLVFAELRLLVRQWAHDAISAGSFVAEALISQIFRWLSSPSAALYDPALCSFVNNLMRKVMMLLVAELRRLGAAIVYANDKFIIIATGKRTAPNAKTFVEYLLKAIKAQPVFEYISLGPHQYYHRLLWMNPVNFASVLVTDNQLTKQQQQQQQQAQAQQPKNKRDGDYGDDYDGLSEEDSDYEAYAEARSYSNDKGKVRGKGKGKGKTASSYSTTNHNDNEDDIDEYAHVQMVWSIKYHLPSALHELFDDTIKLFMSELHTFQHGGQTRSGLEISDKDVAGATATHRLQLSQQPQHSGGQLAFTTAAETEATQNGTQSSTSGSGGGDTSGMPTIGKSHVYDEAEPPTEDLASSLAAAAAATGESFYASNASAVERAARSVMFSRMLVSKFFTEKMMDNINLILTTYLDFERDYGHFGEGKEGDDDSEEEDEDSSDEDGDDSDQMDVDMDGPLSKRAVKLVKQKLMFPDIPCSRRYLEARNSILQSSTKPHHQHSKKQQHKHSNSGNSHSHQGAPLQAVGHAAALEFIKNICAVFNLEQAASNQVRVLRRHLLKRLGISDFSDEAVFVMPSHQLLVTQVCCEFCGEVDDLDFVYDAAAGANPQAAMQSTRNSARKDGKSPANAANALWKCANCENPYDMRAIEERLITLVNRTIAAFQMQDLVCLRCKQVKAENLAPDCTYCRTPFSHSMGKERVLDQLHILRDVAKFNGLQMVLEVIDETGLLPNN